MFLHVKFHDNDFSQPLTEALEELWNYINENNGSMTKHRSVIEMFQALDDSKLLKAMVIRLWTLKSIARHVEWECRGLHWEKLNIEMPNWVDVDKEVLPVEDEYTKYFNAMSIEFVKHKSTDDENGEHGWIDLNTGYVFIT